MKDQEKFCPVIPIVIGSVWCVFGVFVCFLKECKKWEYEPLFIILAHIAFCIFFIVSIFFLYKVFVLKTKITAEENAKQKKIEDIKELEQLQKKKYEEEKAKEVDESDFNKKVEDACQSILMKWQDSYQENLKSLEANLKLYNEVKKIVEKKPEVEEKKENLSSPNTSKTKKS